MSTTLNKNDNSYTLRLKRRLNHSPEKVWRVLTQRDLLKQWFPCDVVGEWRVGEPLKFNFLHGEGEGLSEDELSGEVLSVVPEKLLEFRWGKHFLRCELEAEPDGCPFTFSETIENPSWGARNAAGWEMCLENLDLLLEGAAAAKFVVEVWQEKFDKYRNKFEPEAGPQEGMPDNFSADET